MYHDLLEKKKTLAVIGLGYVGLPIALAFAKKIKVIGFDINAERVEMMRRGIDPSQELESSSFENCDIMCHNQLDVLREANFFIVAVPTPVDEHNVPDLVPVQRASETIGKVIKKGDYVVFESTVYPGCTEEDCVPIIENLSGLKIVTDYKIGYSPERINPVDKEHTISTIVKVVSGCCEESLDTIATRLWAAKECLKKVGAMPNAALAFIQATEQVIWFQSGIILEKQLNLAIATFVITLKNLDSPLVIALLISEVKSGQIYPDLKENTFLKEFKLNNVKIHNFSN